LNRILLLAAVLSLTACPIGIAPGYVGPNEVATWGTKGRHQYHGFSVEPPRARGWNVRVNEQRPNSAVYRLELPSKTHTFVAVASLLRFESDLPIPEALVPRAPTNSPNEVLSLTHEPDLTRKTPCIRYSLELRVRNAVNSPGQPLRLVERGLSCAHPTVPGAGVRAFFSERGLPHELDPSLWEGLEAFLGSVQLESAEGVPVS
jgi:hypothetical protein